MIANTRVSHRLSWRNYAFLVAALAVLPCLLTFTEAQEVVPVDLTDVAADDAVGGAKPHETERRIYRVQKSDRGLVVLAFDKESKRLTWSSEIELTQPNQAVAGQRFLLHTGGGIVTIAAVDGDKSLKVQELNAESGKVASECQHVGPPQAQRSEAAQRKRKQLLAARKQKQIEHTLLEFDRQADALEQKQLSEGLRTPKFPMSDTDYFRQILKLPEQERSEQEILKAIRQLEEMLKRVREVDRNKRDQGDKVRDQAAPNGEQASSKWPEKPIGVPLSQWGLRLGSDGAWLYRFHGGLKIKDCRSCHEPLEGDSGDNACPYRFHDRMKSKDCSSCHRYE